MNLDKLKAEERNLKALLLENRKKQHDIIIERFCAKTGFKIGDKVHILGTGFKRKAEKDEYYINGFSVAFDKVDCATVSRKKNDKSNFHIHYSQLEKI